MSKKTTTLASNQYSDDASFNKALSDYKAGGYSWDNQDWNENNPYAGIDTDTTLSPWNRFTDWLGFTNNATQAQFQQYQLAKQWESEYSLSMADREYNNEANTASRMRAAGINPDFNGVTGGESALANNEAGQLQNPNIPSSDFTSITTTLGSAISQAFSIVSGMTQLNGQILQQDLATMQALEPGNRNDFVSQFADFLDDDSVDKLLSGKMSVADLTDEEGYQSLDNMLKEWINASHADAYRSKKVRKIAENRLMSYMRSEDFKKSLYDKLAGRYSGRKSAASSKADFDSVNFDAGIVDVLSDLSTTLYKYNKSLSEYNLEYQSKLNPGLAASAVNMTNKEQYDSAKFQNDLNSMKRELVSTLRKDSKSKDKWKSIFANIVLFGFMTASSVPSFLKSK